MKRLTRSSNKMIEGVLGGFAEYIDIDPVWIRLGFVLFALLGGFWIVFFVYIAAAIIMPKEDVVHTEDREVKINNRGNLIIGIGLIFFGIIFLINQFYHINLWYYLSGIYYEFRFYAWAVVLIALGILIIIKGKK